MVSDNPHLKALQLVVSRTVNSWRYDYLWELRDSMVRRMLRQKAEARLAHLEKKRRRRRSGK